MVAFDRNRYCDLGVAYLVCLRGVGVGMKYIARFMLDWIRADIAIAKAAPVWNMDHIEALRREEARWERELGE